ncbi:MAG: CUAEP/CCAEP-tail radical SAM protein [Alphaproteobacteria bacterium]|jgi:radical SAM superfamily enzyme YgiQ (UPF0313 family)|nr:CUAEP/CCAEP-tail radical SAM protein [Alphaproteobacteria bacterium]MDP6516667.1 CUAEP/CCAEP-tail radical SAM protein [Alphaproteobacteria bacterium]
MNVLLLSTYDLGHQPFGLASPAAWLRQAGARVTCNDLAVEDLDAAAVAAAGMIAIHLPMHTATRLAGDVIARIRDLNPGAHLCFYGLYAPMNAGYLRDLGGQSIIGGEFETPLVDLYHRLVANDGQVISEAPTVAPVVALAKQRFRMPERAGLPGLDNYATLQIGDEHRRSGYTEASRGCKHRCRHCPVVPVYDGRFFVVQHDVVMADIATQIAAGARHISFGDPDFFNGVGHALRLVRAVHAADPEITYDATIKVEHLLRQRRHLRTLVETGCLLVTTAVESLDDEVLALLDKGHSRVDFLRAVALARDAGLTLSPTFIPFTPWTTLEGYHDLLREIAALDLIAEVAPIQLAIRLLVPQGSRLRGLAALRRGLGPYQPEALSYPWRNPDPRVEALSQAVAAAVEGAEGIGEDRAGTFAKIVALTRRAGGLDPVPDWLPPARSRAPVPRMSEPWYCCAEPTAAQRAAV